MGYRIDYAVRDGMLRASVSGRAGRYGAGRIAEDICEQAGRETLSRVLIDVRGLADRLGSLGELSMVRCGRRRTGGYRVAMVDAAGHDAYYALHEVAARAQGYVLRCFSSMADAVRWLRSAPGLD